MSGWRVDDGSIDRAHRDFLSPGVVVLEVGRRRRRANYVSIQRSLLLSNFPPNKLSSTLYSLSILFSSPPSFTREKFIPLLPRFRFISLLRPGKFYRGILHWNLSPRDPAVDDLVKFRVDQLRVDDRSKREKRKEKYFAKIETWYNNSNYLIELEKKVSCNLKIYTKTWSICFSFSRETGRSRRLIHVKMKIHVKKYILKENRIAIEMELNFYLVPGRK